MVWCRLVRHPRMFVGYKLSSYKNYKINIFAFELKLKSKEKQRNMSKIIFTSQNFSRFWHRANIG